MRTRTSFLLLAAFACTLGRESYSGEPPLAPGTEEKRPPGRTTAEGDLRRPQVAPAPVSPGRPGRAESEGEARPAAARHFNLARTGEMNVIDEVFYALAEHYLATDRVREALQLVERVASSSPDGEARSVSRYNLGRICEERLGDLVRARTEYARVSGRWGGTARNRVLAPLKRERKWGEALDFLKECLAVSTDPEDKSDIARSMLATIRESGDFSMVESILGAVTAAISYEEAQAAAEARRKKAEELRRSQIELSQPGLSGPPQRPSPFGRGEHEGGAAPAGIKGPFGSGSPAARGTTSAPAPARARPSDRRLKLEAEARELEQAGFEEEAKQVREQLEKPAGNERF